MEGAAQVKSTTVVERRTLMMMMMLDVLLRPRYIAEKI